MQRWGQVGKVFLVFLMFLILLLLFLSLTVVRVQVSYARRGKDDQFTVGFSTWRGLVHYSFELPRIKVKKEKAISPPKWLGTASRFFKPLRINSAIIFYLLEKVRLRRLTWRTEIGTGDPAQTGLLAGVIWGLKGLILAACSRLLAPGGAGPVVEIRPSFDRACFNMAFNCVLDVRLGHIFITGLKYLKIKRK